MVDTGTEDAVVVVERDAARPGVADLVVAAVVVVVVVAAVAVVAVVVVAA